MSILSEISSTLQPSSIKDAVVDMYHTMFNKLNDVKDVFSKKPEILPTIVKDAVPVKDEGYADPPAIPKTGLDIAKATGIKIGSTLLEYGLKLALIIFYLYLASLVANDMIIYAAPIRAFFFVFTLFFTITLFPCAIIVAFYYLLKKGYDYYNQNLSSATVKPPLSFPMIFAILPLTTYYPTSPFARFFLWAFMYQKSDKPERMEKENERLKTIMENYRNDLHSSFEYLEKIKTTPPFSNLYEMIEKKLTIEGMHPIQKPKVEPIETSKVGEAKTASLPATISGKGTSLPATISGKAATQVAPQATSLPATIGTSTGNLTPEKILEQGTSNPLLSSAPPSLVRRPTDNNSQENQSVPKQVSQTASLPATVPLKTTSLPATVPLKTTSLPATVPQPASPQTVGWANGYPELQSLARNAGLNKPIDAKVAEYHRLHPTKPTYTKTTLKSAFEF